MREALRQPLTSIRSLSEILRDNPGIPTDQHERFLAIIIEESQRLDRLVTQFLERAEAQDRAPRARIPANDIGDAAA
ncbi:MAG: histidine kinase dimerization/phospho-acceptor domain-containing protein [Dongiaceae bacterium]